MIFDVIGGAEVERLVKNGIKWEGRIRRVSVLREWVSEKKRMTPPKKVLVQKRKEEAKKGGHQPSKVSFSFGICSNCGGKGHSMKTYTSASKAVFKKIQKKLKLAQKWKKKLKIIDDDGFNKVVNTQRITSQLLD